MRFFGFLPMLCLALLGAACVQATPYPLDAIPEGRVWHVVQIAGKPVPTEVTITRLKEGVLGGMAGCNRYTMRIGESQTELFPGPVATTKMACPHLATESAFVQAMGRIKALRVEAGALLLLDAEGAVLLRAER